MSKRWKASTAEFVWHGEHPDVEVAVRKDLATELVDLRRAEDLVFHDCWLEGDPYGPSVLVWGRDGDACLHCEYHPAKTQEPAS